MHSHIWRNVFSQIIYADIHKFCRIQSTAAGFRSLRSVCTRAMEDIIFNILWLPDIIADSIPVKRVPHDGNIQVIKYTLVIHNDLAGHDFLSRTSVNTDDCFASFGFQSFLKRTCSTAYSGAQKIMPTGMSKLRECIILCEKTNDRLWRGIITLPYGGKSGLNPGGLIADKETFAFQIFCQIFGWKFFLISCFRVTEQIVRSPDQFIFMCRQPGSNGISSKVVIAHRCLLYTSGKMPSSTSRYSFPKRST